MGARRLSPGEGGRDAARSEAVHLRERVAKRQKAKGKSKGDRLLPFAFCLLPLVLPFAFERNLPSPLFVVAQ
jgi:hypothetical protein